MNANARNSRRWALIGAILIALLSGITWSRAQGSQIHYGDTVTGTLKAGAADQWSFTGTAGDVIALTAERVTGDLEPILRLQDGDVNPLVGTQPAAGQATLVDVRLPQTGTYVISVAADGQTSGDYRLTLKLTTPAPQTVTPQITPITDAVAGSITLGTPVQGEVNGKTVRQTWKFTATSGLVVDIKMSPQSGDLDPFLTLVSPNGDVIATNNPANGEHDANIMAFSLAFNGEYKLIARRNGAQNGISGTTAGRYTLSVIVRGPLVDPKTDAKITVLNLGASLQGRLTDNVPHAVYRLDFSGPFAVNLDLGNSHRLGELQILDASGKTLQSVQGLSPLAITARLPDQKQGPFFIQIGSTAYENAPFADFTVTTFIVGQDGADAKAITYGQPRQSLTANPEHWFFIGQTNDLVSLSVTADTAILGSIVRLVGPQDTVLYESELGLSLRQTFTLPKDGLYGVEIRPPKSTDSPLAYHLDIERTGVNNIPFQRFAQAFDQGPLVVTIPTNGNLAAGAADSFWLDAQAGAVINLAAVPTTNETIVGMAVDRPDGALIDAQVSTRTQNALLERVLLSQTGRYRIIVFDAKGSGGKYRLTYEDASGGLIQPGQVSKGIVTPIDGLAVWSIDAAANTLINARLTNLTPPLWTPNLIITDPGGQVIASAGVQGNVANLLGIKAPVSGTYHVLAAGRVVGKFASYNLQSGLQTPFSSGSSATIQVSQTRTPTDRYAPAPVPDQPVHLSIANLIDPPVNVDIARANNLPILAFNTSVRGEVAPGVLSQAWRLSSGSAVMLSLRATALAGEMGPTITLLDASGKTVAEEANADELTTTLNYRTTSGGPLTAVVSLGLKGGRYLLSLNSLDVKDAPLQVSEGTPLTYGQTISGELLDAKASNTYYFLGAVSDVVSIRVTRGAGDLVPSVQLIGPNGKKIADATGDKSGNATLANAKLTDNGLFSITIQQSDKNTNPVGRYFLTLAVSGGLRLRNRGDGIIAPGETQSGLLTLNTRQNTWLFTGYEGQQVTLIASASDAPQASPLSVHLQDTAGTTIAAQDSTLTHSAVKLSNVILPAKGLYRIQVSGGDQTPGVYTLSVLPDQGRIIAGPLRYGKTVGGVFTADRKVETWVFSGTANDLVTISLRYVRGDHFNPGFQIVSESGLTLPPVVAEPGSVLGAQAGNLLLPFSGSYSVIVANADTAFKGSGVYELTITLQDSRARSIGGILTSGQQGQGDLYVDDPSDSWLFTAHAGDKVTLSAQARDQFLKPQIDLKTPSGVVVASASVGQDGKATIGDSHITKDSANSYIIQSDGVYVVTVSGADNTTGSYSLSLDIAQPPTADIPTVNYGDTVRGLVADDRVREAYLFSGRLGDTIEAQMRRESGSNLAAVLELETLDGTLLARADGNNSDTAILKGFKLPATAQYRLIATRYRGAQGQTAGNYTLKLTGTPLEQPVRGTVHYGQLAIGRLSDKTPVDRLSFEGQIGEVVSITTRATSGALDTVLTLESPSGEILAINDDADGTNAVIAGALLRDKNHDKGKATFTITIARIGTSTVGSEGNYELLVNRVYQVNPTAVPRALITYGRRIVGTVDATNAEQHYTFSGSQGDQISVQLTHQTDDAPPILRIQDPTDQTLIEGKLGIGQTTISPYRLPTAGLYTIVVKRPINTKQVFSPFALTLDLLSSAMQPTNGGVLNISEMARTTAMGTFTAGQSAHYWLFEGKTGQVISVDLARLNGNLLPSALLLSPGGQALASVALSAQIDAGSINQITLPVDGVYNLLIVSGGLERAGQYRFILQTESANPTSPVTMTLGQTVSGTLDAIHPEQRWSFSGQKGQTISARLLAMSSGLTPQLHLISTDGNAIAEGTLERSTQGISSVIVSLSLPASGNYTLVASSITLGGGGTYRLSVDTAPLSTQLVAASPINYEQVVRGVVQEGAPGLWAFEGAAGDAVTLSVLSDDPKNIPSVELQNSAGHSLIIADPKTTEIPTYLLPMNGRYLVVVRSPVSTSYTLILQRRQNLFKPNAKARILVPDTAQENGITASNLVDTWTFQADAGHVIKIDGKRLNGDLRLDMTLYGPSGYVISTVASGTSDSATLGPVRLTEKGTYQLLITRWLGASGKTSGRYRLNLSFPVGTVTPVNSVIPVYDRAVIGNLPTSGDSTDNWIFDGQAGDVINIRMTRLDGDLVPTLSLNAGKDVLAKADGSGAEASINRFTLPTDGQYRIGAGRLAPTGGGYRLIIERVMINLQAGIASADGIAYGERKTGELTDTVPVHAWVFLGKAGERVTIAAVADSKLAPSVSLLTPDSKILAANDSLNNGGTTLTAQLTGISLPGDGFYGIVISASPQSSAEQRMGMFSLTVRRDQPGAAYQGQLPVGSTVNGTLTTDQPVQEWAFETGAQAGDNSTIAASIISTAATFNGILTIVTPDGQALAVSPPTRGGAGLVKAILPKPGRYSVLVSANGQGAQGDYRLLVSYGAAPTGGGRLVNDERAVGTISNDDYTDTWRLDVAASTTISIHAERSAGDLNLEITLYGPDGKPLFDQSANGSSSIDIPGTRLATAGRYTLIVSRVGGPGGQTSGNYTLLVSASAP